MRGAKRIAVGVAAVAAAVSCGRGNVWYQGDLGSAVSAAAKRNTLVMAEFYADW